MAYLAVLLKQAGHDVRLLKYHPLDFFEPFVVAKGVRVDTLNGLSPLKRICTVRAYIRNACPDAVIAFLSTPSLLAELSGLPRRRFKIIVSERSLAIRESAFTAYRRFALHAFSDKVVANSYSQAELIRRRAPWLARKTSTILNCVDLETLCPRAFKATGVSSETRFLVLASLSQVKNPLGLVRACAMVRQRRPDLAWTIDWYGNKFLRDGVPAPYSAFPETEAAIGAFGLESCFRLHDPSPFAADLYRGADAVVLPSLYEGCPNVLCEAFACGLPLLASRVSDIPRFVEDGVNGFLFDPHSPEDISRAIERFCDLPVDQRAVMLRANREKAERLFSFERFLREYEELLRG